MLIYFSPFSNSPVDTRISYDWRRNSHFIGNGSDRSTLLFLPWLSFQREQNGLSANRVGQIRTITVELFVSFGFQNEYRGRCLYGYISFPSEALRRNLWLYSRLWEGTFVFIQGSEKEPLSLFKALRRKLWFYSRLWEGTFDFIQGSDEVMLNVLGCRLTY